ncbi:uncharacterized protein TNCV_4017951 [Trichonephila clavipes]|nr:uncharacterized protein TNCV_4017951 [Trichonephila clavipes]
MPDATKYPPSTVSGFEGFVGCITSAEDWRIFPSPSVPCINCGGGDRWCRHLSSLREFRRANSYCPLYGAQGQGLAHCHNEFRWPRPDYVRQVTLETTTKQT